MSLIDLIRDIQNNSTLPDNKTPAWEHNDKIIAILKKTGEYRIPAPKTYITDNYIPPSNFNSQLNQLNQYQFYSKNNIK